jgi:hypothetical protein
MRIRVTTRAELFEKRKQEHIERGYRVEDQRPIPVNGFCSFVAVRELPVSEALAELVAEAQRKSSTSPKSIAERSSRRRSLMPRWFSVSRTKPRFSSGSHLLPLLLDHTHRSR